VSSNPKACIGVSYAWKEEGGNNPLRAKAVDKFCKALESEGKTKTVVRDVDQLSFGDSLSQFMKNLGAADRLFVFLSDSYLRSPNCMLELHTAWEVAGQDAEVFRQRVKAWVLPGSLRLSNAEDRAIYTEYWEKEERKSSQVIKDLGVNGSGSELEKAKRCKKIAADINGILNFINDTLLPRTLAEFVSWAETELGVTILASDWEEDDRAIQENPPLSAPVSKRFRNPEFLKDQLQDPEFQKEIEGVFGKQFKKLKSLLGDHEAFRTFLREHFADILPENATLDSDKEATCLILLFHLRFLESIAAFYRFVEEEQGDPELIRSLLQNQIPLSMDAEFAKTTKKQKGRCQVKVHPEIQHAVGEMISCWHSKGKGVWKPKEKAEAGDSFAEGLPLNTEMELEAMLCERYGVEIDRVKTKLEDDYDFGHAVYVVIPDDAELANVIAENPPYEKLLVLFATEGATIHREKFAEYQRELADNEGKSEADRNIPELYENSIEIRLQRLHKLLNQ